MAIRVDDDGLGRDGAGLVASGQPGVSGGQCQPAAGDPTSAAAAAVFDTAAAAAEALLDHAAAHRVAGGLSVADAGRQLAETDAFNGVAIAAITGTNSATPPPEGAAPVDVPMMAAPVVPTLPTLPESVPPMTGEQIAEYVHNGAGADSVRELARFWRSMAAQVSGTADETLQYGTAIDAHWEDDGRQRAGSNVAEHANWLASDMHSHIVSLAQRAEEYASHVEEWRTSTPRPEEFAELRQQLSKAMDAYRASGGLNSAPLTAVSAKLAAKQSEAIEAYGNYTAATATTVGSVPTPPAPAPPIVRGGAMKTMQQPSAATGNAETEDRADVGLGGNEPSDDAGGDNPAADVAGEAITSEDAVPAGVPTGVAAATPMDTAPGMVANIAGTIVGAATGAAGQLAGGLPGAGAGSMLPNALSSLTSALPGLGGGSGPSMPSGLGEGSPADLGLDDLGAGETTPASSPGGGPSGGPGGGPVSGASPAISPSGPAAAAPAAPISTSAAAPSGGAAGGMGGMGGMYPPMMGGLGGNSGDREKRADQRAVIRQTPNSEPVFGAVERKRSTGGRRRRREEGKTNDDGAD
ncbi:hypothetical protein KL864_33250 [Mycolicibacterium goodii]|uniref:hypothetical protein n=1 Tax=Mycolicibacterium goodii TaxID=134601 RepID=UPI001BDD498B|nr:hypothetical protein [Mycolicibacterium goodii]MBU8820738.1 hypothetical protein [Mycolicibacterium goodii]